MIIIIIIVIIIMIIDNNNDKGYTYSNIIDIDNSKKSKIN